MVSSKWWRGRPVLVTGAAGLLGSWVVRELLAAEARVIVLLRDHVPESHLWQSSGIDRTSCVYGALEDLPLMLRAINEYEVRTVLHLGAQTIVPTAQRNPLSTFESNIRGTWTLLEACRIVGNTEAIVVASSDKAYGEPVELPLVETMPLQGRDPYDVSKSCADLISLSYAETYGSPVGVTRCGNLYGPGDLNFSRIVPGTIRSVLRNERPLIRSDGSPVRDYFFVRDAARACVLLAEWLATTGNSEPGHAFNFSDEHPLTVLEITRTILEQMGSDLEPRVLNEARGEIQEQYLSADKARRLLGWSPTYPLEEGLKETIAWYEALAARGPG